MLSAKSGFSLFELLLVLAIFLLLATASLPIYRRWQTDAQVNESAAQLLSSLRLARSRSVAGDHGLASGVYLDINPIGPDRYVVYRGSSFSAPGRDASADQVVNLLPVLTLGSDLPSPDINFSRGLGLLPAAGQITIGHQVYGTRSISVNQFGAVTEN